MTVYILLLLLLVCKLPGGIHGCSKQLCRTAEVLHVFAAVFTSKSIASVISYIGPLDGGAVLFWSKSHSTQLCGLSSIWHLLWTTQIWYNQWCQKHGLQATFSHRSPVVWPTVLPLSPELTCTLLVLCTRPAMHIRTWIHAVHGTHSSLVQGKHCAAWVSEQLEQVLHVLDPGCRIGGGKPVGPGQAMGLALHHSFGP